VVGYQAIVPDLVGALAGRCLAVSVSRARISALAVVGTSEWGDAGRPPFAFLCVLDDPSPPLAALSGMGWLSGVVTSWDNGDFEAGRVAGCPDDGGFSSAAGFVVGGEVAEEGVAGLQVSTSHHQAKAVAGAEEGCGGAERDQDVDLLVVANRLEGAEGVFGLVG
jgi:hypothetical protein